MRITKIAVILFVGILLMSGFACCPKGEPTPPTLPPPWSGNQRIEYTMPAGAAVASCVYYSNALEAGDKVTGYVELTGQYYSVDWSYQWRFQVLGPGGESIQYWTGHWVNNNHHDFSFTASYAGNYKILVTHWSSYSKDLVIEIQPPGWGYAGCPGPTPAPTPTPTPSLNTQRIEYTMPAGAVSTSSVSYSKVLNTGTRVSGYVELTGQYYSVDWSYAWRFQVFGPGGESIQDWTGHWVNNNHHDFSFTASYAGTYKILVTHWSSYSKDLVIEVQPPGWGYAGP